jgi:hypothetical protein
MSWALLVRHAMAEHLLLAIQQQHTSGALPQPIALQHAPFLALGASQISRLAVLRVCHLQAAETSMV